MHESSSPEPILTDRSFFGEYQRGMDKKGRVILPAPIRETLGDEEAYITKGLDRCLMLLPASTYQRLRAKAARLPLTSRAARQYKRIFFSGAAKARIDGMGRISIPEPLRKYAQLKDDVVFAGVDSHVEIWDAKRWQEEMDALHDESMLQNWEMLDI